MGEEGVSVGSGSGCGVSAGGGAGSGDGQGSRGAKLAAAGRWLVRVIVAGLVALLVASLPFELFSEGGINKYMRLKKELKNIRQRNQRLTFGVRRLRREIRELRHDDEALEEVARDELGLIRDGEIVFIVQEKKWP
jgi:cell division protein FtsB